MSLAAPILLGVNIDHAATLRQARYREFASSCGGNIEPDPLLIALLAERAGADGITLHLREDRRHIQETDVLRIQQAIGTRLNLEMACTPAMLDFALELRPAAVCLVPEGRDEVTTEGGLDVAGQEARIADLVGKLTAAGIEVSLFIDPETPQVEAAARCAASHIELHTGAFANAWHQPEERQSELDRLIAGSELAHRAGLVVNAGHGINYVNIRHILTVPHLNELNIGHSILSRALFTGIEEAVREMKERMAGRP